MALTHIPLSDIAEAHLQRLITTQAAESLHVEYKRETYGAADDARREFLADVSSFANTAGGDLVIGIEAEKGVTQRLSPFAGDADTELLRLENMARDGLSPRITNLRARAVPLGQGGCAIVVRIPKSYNPPHRVIFKNSGRFWARSSAGKYEPNVDELRRIFTELPVLADRIRTFRTDRLVKIAAAQGPITLAGTCLLVLHVVPYSSLTTGPVLSVADLEAAWMQFPPLGRNRGTHRIVNFDGFMVLSNANAAASQHHSYAQVFRTGVVEAVATIDRSDGAVLASRIETYVVGGSKRYIDALATFDLGSPIAIVASLLGVGGRKLESGIDNLYPPYGEQVIADDQLHFSECVFETAPTTYTDCAISLMPLLEQVWNTAGFAEQPTIRDGRWLFGST